MPISTRDGAYMCARSHTHTHTVAIIVHRRCEDRDKQNSHIVLDAAVHSQCSRERRCVASMPSRNSLPEVLVDH